MAGDNKKVEVLKRVEENCKILVTIKKRNKN